MFAAMRLSVAVFVLVFFAGAASCQVSTSNYAYGTFDNKGFDTINVGNLNTHFSIPVINKSGRGLSFNYNLSYDSSVWVPVSVDGVMTWTPVQNFGWRGDTEIATGYLSFNTTILDSSDATELAPAVQPLPPSNCVTELHTFFVYHDPFGVSHPFPNIETISSFSLTGSTCGDSVPSGTEIAPDGSGYTLNVTNFATGTITSANGKAMVVPNVNNGAATATDSNGNEISVNGTGEFTDTLGTNVLTVAGTAPDAHTFSYTNPAGTTSKVTMNYTTFTVATDFEASEGGTGTPIAEFGATATPLVTNVVLADGSTYTFTYESTPGSCTPLSGTDSSGCVTGRIASVSLPTGGTISYSYTGGSNGIESDGSASGLIRTDDTGAMWSYTRGTPSKALGPGAAWTTTIMAPLQNETRNTYVASFSEDSGSTNNPYLTQEQFYQGSNSPGNLLQTTVQCYNANYVSCAGATISTPFTQVDTYKELPSGSARLSEVLYNTYGLVTDDREYNYGVTLGAAPSSASIISETTTSFNGVTTSGIASEVATQVVYNGSSATAAKLSSATFTYDGVATTATSGTPQHVAVSGGNGNLTNATYMTGNKFGPLAYNYTYYDTGNPNTVTGVNGAVTTYVYGSSSCGNSFPTLVEEPLGLSRSIVWNCTGGVSTQVTDENGNLTTASFTDPNFWRPTQTTDQANNATTISYHGATSVESSLVFNSGGSVSGVLTTVDGYGRPAFTQKLQGPSATDYDTTEVDYNSTGQPFRTTLPYSAAASPSSSNASAPATTKTFDALGRVLTITKGDTGTISYTYTNNDVLQTASGSQAFKKQLEYDGMGRLTSVCEISSSLPGVASCGQGVSQNGYLTKYTYDGLGHLLTVTQNAQAPGSSQTRSFAYDLMGRMTSEMDPETGTFQYFWDGYPSGCNVSGTVSFPGNLAATEDNSGVFLCAAYDQRNRLTGYGNNATKTNCRGFVYDTATNTPPAGLSNTKDRLLEAYTNSTCDGHNDVVTDEFFSYSVRGEMTDVYESTPGSNGFYHSNSTYYPTGAVATLTIPGIPTVTYGGLDGEGRYTTVNMSSGSLVSSATYSTSSSGNALGVLTGITFGSGNTESFSTNPSTGRETNYTVTIGGVTDSGTLTWNSNGTLGQLAIADNVPGTGDSQTCTYGYDDLKRISSVNCGALWGQTFTYDAFGNISKNVPSGSAGLIFNPTYNKSSNRLATLPSGASPMYDTNGRLLQDNLNSYSWDNYGDMVTASNGSTTVTAIYDAFGRMVQSSQDGEFIWTPVGQSFTALASGQTTGAAQIPLLGGAIAFYGPSGAIFYRFPDHLGNSRIDSKPSGAFFSATAFGPFGEQYATSGAGDVAFTGYQQDEFTDGLYDFPFRKLSSSQGRWISPDPKGVGAVTLTNPQSWNRYAYVLNNPMASIDPLGLEEDACDGYAVCYDGGDPTDGGGGGDDGGGSGTISSGGGSSGTDGSGSGYVWDPANECWDSYSTVNGALSVNGCLNSGDSGTIGNLLGGVVTGGGGISNGNAPNNTPTALSCLGNTVFSKVGAQTLLDGLGVIPGEGNALAAVQLTAGIVSGGIAASNQDATGAGLSLGGLIPTAASNSGVRLVVKGFSVIPLLGNAVSLVATANDVFGENGAVSTFKNCINGTHP